ncbi:hypothetical protein E2P81_ATG02985 [Venturia nashicola]|nr:hypothetical protein E2P81_ATG02985 [Venturia nashicola]
MVLRLEMQSRQMAQYKRQDWSECTSVNCASKNIGAGNLIDWAVPRLAKQQAAIRSHAGGFYCAPGTGVRPKSDHSLLR